MISSIAGGGMMMPPPPPPSGQKSELTDDQSAALSELLESYEGGELSDEEATQLVSSIKELGISPGSGLTEALSEAGIDARELGDQAGVGGPPPPPPGGGGSRPDASSVDEAVVSMIQDAVDAYSESSGEESFGDYLSSLMEAQGYEPGTSLVDFYV